MGSTSFGEAFSQHPQIVNGYTKKTAARSFGRVRPQNTQNQVKATPYVSTETQDPDYYEGVDLNEITGGLTDSQPSQRTIVGYGGFWVRALASIIDSFTSIFIAYVLASIALTAGILSADPVVQDTMTATGMDPNGLLFKFNVAMSALSIPVSILMGILYFVGFEGSKMQATPGKMALGLRVSDENGNCIGYLRAFCRYLAKIPSGILLCIGYMMVAFSSKKQGLHDLICSTYVVKSA